MMTFLVTIENHGLAMNALAVIAILALLAIAGSSRPDYARLRTLFRRLP
jgi:hypothetical protein